PDPQRTAGHARALEALERLRGQPTGDVDQGEAAEDVDLADVLAGQAALARQRAHESTRLDAVAVPHRDPPPSGTAGDVGVGATALTALGAVTPLLAGRRQARSLELGVHVVPGARTLVAHGERNDAGQQVDRVHVRVLGQVDRDGLAVQVEATGHGPLLGPA